MFSRLFSVLGLALLAGAPAAFGTPISIDGSYHEFLFSTSPGTAVTSCGGTCVATSNPVAEQTSSPPWTFSGAAKIFVLDLFAYGDRFELFDNSVSLGLTSSVVTGGGPCGGDIACAIADSGYSRGSFDVGAGSHSLTINFVSGFGQGAAVFQVGAVPEPSTFGLVAVGLGALAAIRRKRQ